MRGGAALGAALSNSSLQHFRNDICARSARAGNSVFPDSAEEAGSFFGHSSPIAQICHNWRDRHGFQVPRNNSKLGRPQTSCLCVTPRLRKSSIKSENQ